MSAVTAKHSLIFSAIGKPYIFARYTNNFLEFRRADC